MVSPGRRAPTGYPIKLVSPEKHTRNLIGTEQILYIKERTYMHHERVRAERVGGHAEGFEG